MNRAPGAFGVGDLEAPVKLRVRAVVWTPSQLRLRQPADAQDRAQVGRLAAAVQGAMGEAAHLAHVDQGHTGAARFRRLARDCEQPS